jgi:hypothetical protein
MTPPTSTPVAYAHIRSQAIGQYTDSPWNVGTFWPSDWCREGFIKYAPTICSRADQWLRSLRHKLSSSAETLGSWVRIPLEAWMSVYVYSVFVLSCVQVAALQRADPWLRKRSRNSKSGQSPTKGCRAIDMFSNDTQFSLILSSINMVIFGLNSICLLGSELQIWPQDV